MSTKSVLFPRGNQIAATRLKPISFYVLLFEVMRQGGWLLRWIAGWQNAAVDCRLVKLSGGCRLAERCGGLVTGRTLRYTANCGGLPTDRVLNCDCCVQLRVGRMLRQLAERCVGLLTG